MPTPLTDDERTEMKAAHPAWTVDQNEMRRTFEFDDFTGSMGFVTRVALAAERADHHPDIDIRWNKVTLVLSTHSEGTLTELDAALAKAADEYAAG